VRLAALLLILIAATHDGYEPLAQFYEDPDRAARALFYIFRGMEGAILFMLVGLLARQRLVWLVCAWGFYEEGSTAVCRLSAGVVKPVEHHQFEGICGNGWYMAGVLVAAGLALMIHDNKDK
jgi:hypothetical protein